MGTKVVVMTSRRLLVLRHAKSSWHDPDLEDHDRPLNVRGRDAAARVGEYLRQEGIRPDLVLCSPAERARQTLEGLGLGLGEAGEAGEAVETSFEPDLYGGRVSELISRVRRVPDTVSSVLVIGHNPGLHELCATLAADPSAVTSFPTAALAELAFGGSWADLGPGLARVTRFVVPREL